jgi:hypothetical protein
MYYDNHMSVGERLNCRRCGHEWYARAAGRPVQCPRCKSPAWDRELKVSEAKVEYSVRSAKRQRNRARPAIKRAEEDVDFTKLASFGMWKDLTETDEELLNRLGSGFGSAEDWSETGEE